MVSLANLFLRSTFWNYVVRWRNSKVGRVEVRSNGAKTGFTQRKSLILMENGIFNIKLPSLNHLSFCSSDYFLKVQNVSFIILRELRDSFKSIVAMAVDAKKCTKFPRVSHKKKT